MFHACPSEVRSAWPIPSGPEVMVRHADEYYALEPEHPIRDVYHGGTLKGGPHLQPRKVTLGSPQRPGVSFLGLPGEVRNRIYQYILGMDRARVPYWPWGTNGSGTTMTLDKENAEPTDLTVYAESPGAKVDPAFGILRVCRQVEFEARTLFNNRATAYIPVSPRFNILEVLLRKAKSVGIYPFESTLMAAMSEVKDLHLHVHLELADEFSTAGPILDMITTLRHLKNSYQDRWAGQRRSITLHLDHFFSDNRRSEVPLQSGSLYVMVTTMGNMADHHDFTLCYYVHTGDEPENRLPEQWRRRREAELWDLESKCARHTNIKSIRPEVYGMGAWRDLNWEGSNFPSVATTDVTPQSEHWPSYPKDLHGPHKTAERKAYQYRRGQFGSC